MQKRQLGRSKIEVSPLGLGGMAIGGPMTRHQEKDDLFFIGEVDDDKSIYAIHYALDMGINFFDTAPAYGAGHSEKLLGRAIAGRRDKVVIATKFGKWVDEKKKWYGRYSSSNEVVKNIRNECVESLRRLQTDYIDLYQFHLLDFPLDQAAEARAVLEELVTEGKIRYYGWSTDDPERIRFIAQGEHCTAIQHYLNVLDDAPEILDICDEYDQASIARGPLSNGFITGKYTPENLDSLLSPDDRRLQFRDGILKELDKFGPAIRELLKSDGRTVVQGALAWIWARSARTIPIPGFRTLAQVEENIKAMEFGPLQAEQMNEIDELLGRAVTSYEKE